MATSTKSDSNLMMAISDLTFDILFYIDLDLELFGD